MAMNLSDVWYRRRQARGDKSLLVKPLFKVAGDAKNFFEIGNIAEKHRSQHGFIIAAPVGKLVLGRYEPERARLVGRVIHPRITEEYLPMLGDAFEKGHVSERVVADSGSYQAPEVVVVARHANLSRFVDGPKGFLMKETCLFPEGAFGGEYANREGGVRIEGGKLFGNVWLNDDLVVWPVIGASAEFDFYDWSHVTGRLGLKEGWIMEKQALSV
jgi:hypothetical protein